VDQDNRWDLLFALDDLTRSEVRQAEAETLRPGEVRLAVERFALSMNNVTYARLGDCPDVPFWAAFPAPAGYGRVPTWGFATVTESRHPDIREGGRYHGLLPMSTHMTVAPEPTARGFRDAYPHRNSLHEWYRSFRRVGSADRLDDARTVLWPIYPAAFNLGDFARRYAAAGAKTVLITSASSKTALGLAHLLSEVDNLTTVGFTSLVNVGFVERLDLYETVVPYEDTDSVPISTPAVLVDFAGSRTVVSAVHRRFNGELTQTALVGYTRPDAELTPPELPGQEPTTFFTPEIEEETAKVEGPDRYYARYERAEQRFVEHSTSWLDIRHQRGPEAIADVFRALLTGDVPASVGNVLSPR
jgi:hypothetical protein